MSIGRGLLWVLVLNVRGSQAQPSCSVSSSELLVDGGRLRKSPSKACRGLALHHVGHLGPSHPHSWCCSQLGGLDLAVKVEVCSVGVHPCRVFKWMSGPCAGMSSSPSNGIILRKVASPSAPTGILTMVCLPYPLGITVMAPHGIGGCEEVSRIPCPRRRNLTVLAWTIWQVICGYDS